MDGVRGRAEAREAAESAAAHAGVVLGEPEEMPVLREVSLLLESVWGRNDEGVPLPSEVLRALVHAGGCVTEARDAAGRLVAAAVQSVAAPAGTTYSLIAAAAPGSADRGLGRAVKLRQRAWALDHGYDTMVWTFDPLVGRNARFNLVRLGAVADGYECAFYGVMSDDLNGPDEADRLVVRWQLRSVRAATAAAGMLIEPAGPDIAAATDGGTGPDGAPMVVRDATGLWCRVPSDVVALRRSAPDEASRWRKAVRDVLTAGLAEGRVATSMTRDGWFLLARAGEEP